MWMGIRLAGATVCRPPRVSHPSSHLEEVTASLSQGADEVVDRIYLLERLHAPCVRQGQGEPRRIVAPVLEIPQALHQDFDTPLLANVTNNPTHVYLLALWVVVAVLGAVNLRGQAALPP